MRRWVRHLPLPLAVLGMVLFGVAQYLKWPAWVGLSVFVLAALMLVIGLLMELEAFARLRRRGARFGFSVAVAALFVLAIIVSANVIAYRHTRRWDLTELQMFSLSDQTRKVLGQLQEPIRIIGFFTADNRVNERRFDDLMEEYRAISPHITVEKYDPTLYPTLAQQFQITAAQMVVVALKDRFEKTQDVTEAGITSALIRLLHPEKPIVCYLTGHGELPLSAFQQAGAVSGFRQVAERENYEFKEIPFFDESRERECRVVLIVGPKYEPPTKETEALSRFLQKGGRVWVNLEADAHPRWAEWLQSLGVRVQQDVVIDPVQAMVGSDPSVAQMNTRLGSPLSVQRSTPGFIAYGQTVQALSDVAGSREAEVALTTTQYSWADRNRDLTFQEGTDEKGPLTVGVLVRFTKPSEKTMDAPSEAPPKGEVPKKAEIEGKKDEKQEATGLKVEGRLAVVGDADWLTDGLIGVAGNAVIALNTLAWLAQREVLISEK
ncbi:MAG: Gldg family protein, partial [Acidobacteria bacterium]|nr:Gldg family protein [Acidobacteriota bacterium]MDW7983175.1 Gldg family protein [Acidobacteriota bacterium]